MVEPGDHGNSPRVFLAARTFSTPIAIAAVRCGTLSRSARATIWVEGAVEDVVFAPHHLLFLPEQLLQILHPFEVADHHAAGIAEDVRDHEDLVPALVQHQVGIRRGRAVGAFGQHPALQVFRDLGVDHPLHRRRHQHVARQHENLRGSKCSWLEKPAMLPCCRACRISARDIEPARDRAARRCDRDRDHLEAIMMQLQRRIAADIAETLDDRGGTCRGRSRARSARAWRDRRRRGRWPRAGPACRRTPPACR